MTTAAPRLEDVTPIRLDGRGVVILGAGGGGIGTILARILAAAGARLLCVDVDPALAQAVADEVGGEAYAADITDRVQMEGLFARADALFGRSFYGLADIVGLTISGRMEEQDDGVIDRTLDMNLRHAILAVQIAAPMLAKRGGGSMVFVSSLSGSNATPGAGLYSIAKAGLEQLVRQAAFDYGPSGVCVNAVAPGLTLTPTVSVQLVPAFVDAVAATIPLRKLGASQDQSNAIYFLLSDLASHVSGSVIHVDGGQLTGANLPDFQKGT